MIWIDSQDRLLTISVNHPVYTYTFLCSQRKLNDTTAGKKYFCNWKQQHHKEAEATVYENVCFNPYILLTLIDSMCAVTRWCVSFPHCYSSTVQDWHDDHHSETGEFKCRRVDKPVFVTLGHKVGSNTWTCFLSAALLLSFFGQVFIHASSGAGQWKTCPVHHHASQK